MTVNEIYSLTGTFVLFIMLSYLVLNTMGYFRKKPVKK
jgi:hypothetical protein